MDFPLIKRKPDIELSIQRDEASSSRQKLLDLKNDPSLRCGASAVYIYALVDEVVNYPNCSGSIIYIGETCRKGRTADRFGQHISTGEHKGGDTGTNYTLSRYYWLGKKLELKIYILKSKHEAQSRHLLEARLLKWHMQVYGALPIAQGASGENYRVSMIDKL